MLRNSVLWRNSLSQNISVKQNTFERQKRTIFKCAEQNAEKRREKEHDVAIYFQIAGKHYSAGPESNLLLQFSTAFSILNKIIKFHFFQISVYVWFSMFVRSCVSLCEIKKKISPNISTIQMTLLRIYIQAHLVHITYVLL